ncbi:hypothetical protein Tco_1032875 [Tanacetum coccineum]|uniref:Uncharacterized protein n=1 Tax=Tanacetum coccineum TaxID=301880 RepID=A0ABQ5GDW2_9ASTR
MVLSHPVFPPLTGCDIDTAYTLCFQLGGFRKRMTWRQFILALGLHTELEMAEARDYWMEISSGKDFLGSTPSYVLIRDPMRRLYHRMIAYSISGHFIGAFFGYAFGLVSDEGLRGLQVVTRELPLIDLHELGRLNICTRYGETWTWVAHGLERQQAAAAGVVEADEAGQGVGRCSGDSSTSTGTSTTSTRSTATYYVTEDREARGGGARLTA